MEKTAKVAHDIIIKLVEETEKDIDLNDPYIQKLIHELNACAQIASLEFPHDKEYYSVKDVAELFDVNKQTVYKWIKEDKIEYRTDESPGKIKRNGYQIPKEQFRSQNKMHEVDPTFQERRDKDLDEIPNTNPKRKYVPSHEEESRSRSYEDIKRSLTRKNK